MVIHKLVSGMMFVAGKHYFTKHYINVSLLVYIVLVCFITLL